MNFAEDLTRLIGRTPLVKLSGAFECGSNAIYAKLEMLNPGGSVKDRAALCMLDEAERQGKISRGSTIIEATSGNTGIALAMISAVRGYKLLILMPEVMSRERREVLELFGAEVKLTPAHLGMEGAVEAAERLHDETPGSFLVRQFDNPANPLAHELTTAEEILEDTKGKLDVLVAGSGTGGTVSGLGRKLKRYKESIRIVAVEPEGSPVLSGGEAGPHMIQGIGPNFVPSIFDRSVVDAVVSVSDEEALKSARKLARSEGLLAGISSGAALSGALKYVESEKLKNANVVVIFPDSGERNLSLLLSEAR